MKRVVSVCRWTWLNREECSKKQRYREEKRKIKGQEVTIRRRERERERKRERERASGREKREEAEEEKERKRGGTVKKLSRRRRVGYLAVNGKAGFG